MPAGPAPHSSASQSNITCARSMLCGRYAPSHAGHGGTLGACCCRTCRAPNISSKILWKCPAVGRAAAAARRADSARRRPRRDARPRRPPRPGHAPRRRRRRPPTEIDPTRREPGVGQQRPRVAKPSRGHAPQPGHRPVQPRAAAHPDRPRPPGAGLRPSRSMSSLIILHIFGALLCNCDVTETVTLSDRDHGVTVSRYKRVFSGNKHQLLSNLC